MIGLIKKIFGKKKKTDLDLDEIRFQYIAAITTCVKCMEITVELLKTNNANQEQIQVIYKNFQSAFTEIDLCKSYLPLRDKIYHSKKFDNLTNQLFTLSQKLNRQ
jgi:hypothetical protein